MDPSISVSPEHSGDADRLAETTVIEGGGANAAELPTLPRGTNVGRYVVIDVIGRGGMGVVYSAFDPELDRKVALKLLRPEVSINASAARARDRLLREAQAMAKLSHANVLPVFDVGTYESAVFVALELVDGETMRAWIDRTRPSWDVLLPVMIAAGRGLAAAHDAGLVHRDFKPENVLLGRNGEVRVMDFGLARASADSEAPESTRTDGNTSLIGDGPELTKTGFVLGTPAYMAPEQHRGQTVDPRADQFAYCVSLYEGLYRERPFAGRVASEVLAATEARAIRPSPRGSDVPRWLRRAALRGLAPEPGERWHDMNALLDELALPRGGRARLAMVVGATAAIAVAGGFAFGRRDEDHSACVAAGAAIASVWNDTRADAIASHYAGTDIAYASDTWTRGSAMIDVWTTEWSAARVGACEATQVRREQSEAMLASRNACLDRLAVGLDGALGIFESADRAVVDRTVTSLMQLEPPSECARPEALSDTLPDPAIAAEVDRLRGDLSRARVLRTLGRYDDELALATTVRDAADALGFPPLIAEARMAFGVATADLGQLEPGAQEIIAAIDLAETLALDLVVARGAAELVEIAGIKQGKTAWGERWAEVCTAKLRRIGGDDVFEARMLLRRASVADESGDFAAARRHASRAVELLGRSGQPSADASIALANLGRVAFRAQDFAGALAHFERARDEAISAYGPRHPEVGKILSNIGASLNALGELERGSKIFDEALALLEAVLPPDHPDIALTLTNVAALAYRTGRYDYAIEVSQRVIDMRRRVLGERNPKIAGALNNQAISLLALNRFDEALQRYEEAMSLYDEAYPDGHPDAMSFLAGAGECLLRKGDFDGAIVKLERAAAMSKREGVNPYAAAEAEFMLARALWDSTAHRDRARALLLATAAASTIRQGPAHEQRHLEGIEQWLREHEG